MNKNIILKVIILFGVVLFALIGVCKADEAVPQLSLNLEDRILVIAPHPDDEAIAAAGVIQEAVRLRIPLRVMYLTNGDSNQLSFLVYKKHFVFGSNQVLAMGELRQREAVAAMKHLGLTEEQLIFLGYPDYGTLNIFKKSWKEARPNKGTFTRVTSVPYERSLTPGALYKGESILEDYKKVLSDFKPTKIFVNHPADSNQDHQAAYLFLRAALWDLDGKINNPEVHSYLIHSLAWPRPLGLHPKEHLYPDKNVRHHLGDVISYELKDDQVEKKKEAVYFYRTQIPYKPNFLFTFVRSNELFLKVSDILLNAQILDKEAWEGLDAVQQVRKANRRIDMRGHVVLGPVVYALEADGLTVKIKLNQWSRLGFNINLYLFGYKKDIPFKNMPKYRLELDDNLQAVVFDGQVRVKIKSVKVYRSGNDVFVSIGLKDLRDPDYMIASASVRIQNLPKESSMWNFLSLDYVH